MSRRNKTLYFDIETNALEDFSSLSDLGTVHCLSIYDPVMEKMVTFSGDSIPTGLQELDSADTIVGHNVIGFDLPALKRLYSWTPRCRVLDTMITSRCVHSDLFSLDMTRDNFPKELWGSHSLKAWGFRIGSVFKDAYGEEEGAFDEYNEDMKKYCERDVIVTQAIGSYMREMEPTVTMLNIEHEFAHIIRKQEMVGFRFDEDKAVALEQTLTMRRAELKDELHKTFEPTVEEMKTPSGYTLEIDGKEYFGETKAALKRILKEEGQVQALVNKATKLENKTKSIPFNPGSRDQIAQRLQQLGWKPKLFTPDGKPKIDEAVLKGVKHPSADLLLEYLMVTKRLGMLADGENAWLKSVKLGRIHGKVNTNGAVTGRCTHSYPNVAQVPAVRAPYGKECRELFTAGIGYKLVGCDASGLELRMLAHYLGNFDGGQYAKELLTGDIHTMNQKAAGLETRDQAKTFIYAFLYGAGDAKIGEIVGGSGREGKLLKARFLASLPALNKLRVAVEERVRRGGFLRGLDGRILPIRSEHSALNTLLQSAGAVVMKQALILLHTKLTNLGWQHGREYAFVANIHDEFQAEVAPDKAETYGKLAVEAIRAAGTALNMRCPLDGEYKVGDNWAETH
jgi:DNA polymerase I-like protein with 3'-5' exonuclease and polymerase domains